MNVVIFFARVIGSEAEGYHAAMLDLPEVQAAGVALPPLVRDLKAKLMLALRRLEDAGEAWPEPAKTPPADLGPTESLVLIEVDTEDAPVRVNVSIGGRLLRRIDAAAEAQDMTRSGYLAAAARQRLGDEPPHAAGEATPQRLFDEVAAMGRRLTETLGPDSTLGRTLAELDSRALDGLRRVGADWMKSARNGRAAPRDDAA